MVPNRAGGNKTVAFVAVKCYTYIDNKIYGYSQVPVRSIWEDRRIGNGVRVSDRTAAVRPNRSHKPLIERSRRGQGDEAESEDLPVKIHVWFFGLKNNMSLLHGEAAIGGVFIALQDMLDEAPDVLYFCFWINLILM